MKKKLIELKYYFSCEPYNLFYALFDPTAMQNWIAEKVDFDEETGIYTFYWADYSESARIEEKDEYELFLKWKWVDGDHEPDEYISYRINYDEDEQKLVLLIEDFCEEGFEENYTDGWDKLIRRLSRAAV
jgi:hypothetical protein